MSAQFNFMRVIPSMTIQISTKVNRRRLKVSEHKSKKIWDALTYDQRLGATSIVFRAIHEHMQSCGSFRFLIYNRLGFSSDAYSELYNAGGLDISNMCGDYGLNVLGSDDDSVSSTDSQPDKCQNNGQNNEPEPYKVLKSQPEVVTDDVTFSESNNGQYLKWTTGAPREEGRYLMTVPVDLEYCYHVDSTFDCCKGCIGLRLDLNQSECIHEQILSGATFKKVQGPLKPGGE